MLSHLFSWIAAVEHHAWIKLCGVNILKGQLWFLFNNKSSVKHRLYFLLFLQFVLGNSLFTSPFLPKEMVLASMSRTHVMKSPWVKLLSVSVCSPL